MRKKLIQVSCLPVLLLTIFFLSGCATYYIDHVALEPEMEGKVIQFNEPMIFLIMTKESHAEQWYLTKVFYKGKKIKRVIRAKSDSKLDILTKYPREPIPEGMNFIVMGKYVVRKRGLLKKYTQDLEEYVLRDESGTLSVIGDIGFELFVKN